MHAVKNMMMEGKGSTKKADFSNIQSSSGGGGGGSRKTTPGPGPKEQQKAAAAAVMMMIRCPRCDSENTKFCYYNNYSLSQPRHFCKTCRRYWTNGGALRNVPIGGGCRKNKKILFKSSSATACCSTTTSMLINSSSLVDSSKDLKFFQGGFSSPATHDFQLGALNNTNNQFLLPFGMVTSSDPGHPIANSSTPCFNMGDPSFLSSTTNTNCLMGSFNYPFISSSSKSAVGGGVINYNIQSSSSSNLASSIESLSCLNQDLHWKMQQQRMATMLYATHKERERESNSSLGIEKPQPILFENLEVASKGKGEGKLAKKEDNSSSSTAKGDQGNLATEWYFDPAPTTSCNNIRINEEENNVNTWPDEDGINQAWSNLNQYSPPAFP